MMTSDLAMIGRLGDQVVAAASLAHAILFAVFVLGMGVVSAVATLAAQGYGARNPRYVRRASCAGIWAGITFGVPLSIGMLWGKELLVALGQESGAASIAEQYLIGLTWCLVPAWVFIALRGFMGAVNRPEPALWITLVAIPANSALAYALIFGAAGLPRLEMLGAGIATTIVNILMCAAALWFVQTRRPFRKYHIAGGLWRFDVPLTLELLRVGLPISGAFLLEVGLFSAAALMMGRFGVTALAAHQIALQTAAIMFMVPFGISMAATVRVGHAVGRRDGEGARRAGFTAIHLAVGFMAGMTVLVLFSRQAIPAAFLGEAAAGATETVRLVGLFLVCGSMFFIFDGIQTVAAGALRGLSDTRIPLFLAALGFWGVGFVGSYLLAFVKEVGPVGIWLGLTLGLVSFASMLVARFHYLTHRGRIPG
jgi:MATE family multidrug resistance protein